MIAMVNLLRSGVDQMVNPELSEQQNWRRTKSFSAI